MKKMIVPFLLLFLFVSSIFYTADVDAERPYVKWGEVTMEKTKEKYPNASILDYKHIGRDTGATTSTEKFKLWLKEDNQEFGVFVQIQFNNKTEEITGITFTKMNTQE